MDGGVRIGGDDIVHEVEELDAPPALLVGGRHLAGGHLEGGEQGRCAVALVVVAVAGQRPAVRQLEISLRALQRLDRGLLVDTDDDRVLGRRHVEPDHVGRLGDELGIVALAPGLAPGRSIFCVRRKRQTCCSWTSPSSAAISGPVQRANPAGGGRSSTARMRWPVSAPYFGCGPGRGLSASPGQALAGERPRHGSPSAASSRPPRRSTASSVRPPPTRRSAREIHRAGPSSVPEPAPQAPHDPPASAGPPLLWESSQC